VANDTCAVVAVGVHAIDPEERRTGVFGKIEERGDGVEENILHAAGAPYVRPNVAKGAHYLLCNPVAVLGGNRLQEVERRHVVMVGRVEVDDIAHAMRGYVVEERAGVAAVWVEEGGSPPRVNVLEKKVFE